MTTYRKDDVQRSYHQGHSGDPMVNVKVHAWPLLTVGLSAMREYEPDTNPHFTEEWLDRHVSAEYADDLFRMVCETEWEQLETDAEEIFGKGVEVVAAGRSGGWAVVTGLPDVEKWDAVMLAKWRKFERYAKLIAADVPYQVVSSVYLNDFEAWVAA